VGLGSGRPWPLVANGLDCLVPARRYMAKLGSWIVSRSIVSTHLAVGTTTKLSLIAGMQPASFCQEFDQHLRRPAQSLRDSCHRPSVVVLHGGRRRARAGGGTTGGARAGNDEDTGGGRRPTGVASIFREIKEAEADKRASRPREAREWKTGLSAHTKREQPFFGHTRIP
jgi:hypothetical protein